MSDNTTATLRQRTPDQLSRHKDVAKRLQKVSRQFHGHGQIGEAFQELVKAGSNAKWLERTILNLPRYPLYHQRNRFGYAEQRRLKYVISKIRSVADDLARMRALLALLSFRAKDRPYFAPELPEFFRQIADWLQASKSTIDPHEISSFGPSDRIPYLIDHVTYVSGRPHYREMATLIGAAYGEHNFSEGQLKMFVRRAKAAEERRRALRGNGFSPKTASYSD